MNLITTGMGFETYNPVVNVLFNKKESIYTGVRSDLYERRRKQINLLMIMDGESKHY